MVEPNTRGWRLFVLVLMLVLTLPRLWQRGMFLDGMTYAIVARNMAQGIGTFWAPSFSSTAYREFFEQPPLGMAFEALGFYLFGDHFAVERAFSVLMFLVNGLLIAAIWRQLLPKAYDWLPVLFWLVPSVVTWSVINNMLENTQAVFTSLACYLLLRAASCASLSALVALALGSASAVVAAALTKGPVGLFPLVVPPLCLLLDSNQRPQRLGLAWAVLMLGVTAGAIGLALHDESRRALETFAHTHLVPALSGGRGVGPRGADIARHLTLGIGFRLSLVALVFWLVRRFRARLFTTRPALFFAAVGCAASVPILTSPVLAGHYFLPSTPFFALAFAALALPAVAAGAGPSSAMARRAPYVMAATLAVLAVCIVLLRGTLEPRDRDMVRSLDAIRDSAPVGGTVGACAASNEDWPLRNYMQRFYQISIDTEVESAPTRDWFIAPTGVCDPPPSCSVVVTTERFLFAQCRAPESVLSWAAPRATAVLEALMSAIDPAEHIPDSVLRDWTTAQSRQRLADMDAAIRKRYGGNTTH